MELTGHCRKGHSIAVRDSKGHDIGVIPYGMVCHCSAVVKDVAFQEWALHCSKGLDIVVRGTVL